MRLSKISFIPASFTVFFFLFQPNFLFHYYSPERAAVHKRAWQAGQLLRNILANCGSFFEQPQFCLQQEAVLVSYAITFLWISLFMFSVKGLFSMNASFIMIL